MASTILWVIISLVSMLSFQRISLQIFLWIHQHNFSVDDTYGQLLITWIVVDSTKSASVDTLCNVFYITLSFMYPVFGWHFLFWECKNPASSSWLTALIIDVSIISDISTHISMHRFQFILSHPLIWTYAAVQLCDFSGHLSKVIRRRMLLKESPSRHYDVISITYTNLD